MGFDQLKDKVEELSQRYTAASRKKATLKGQLQAKKEELAALSKEIKDAGYDPLKLKDAKDKTEQELRQLMESFERDLAEVEEALAAFDKK
jgi:chromosome segregation ATPase